MEILLQLTAALALTLSASPPAAAEPAAACTSPADLTATAFASWAKQDAVTGSVAEPEKPFSLDAGDGSGDATIRIGIAGRYGIMADTKVWIDVVASGAALVSVDHGHGPDCSGIRKVVWFDLPVGTHRIALSKAESTRVRLLVVRAP